MNVSRYIIVLCVGLFSIVFFSCKEDAKKVPQGGVNIIPQPNSLKINKGSFDISKGTTLYIAEDVKKLEHVKFAINYLQGMFYGSGIDIKTVDKSLKNQIVISKGDFNNDEAYSIEALTDSDILHIRAKTARGLFYAFQTLRQLLPAKIFGKSEEAKWKVPAVSIEDAPRFSYRGMHLDVGRHYFSLESIKKYIDYIAMHKMNIFHWHLTEDQGWRIEIKKYPKLTEVGAYRDETLAGHYSDKPHKFDGKRYGGFYTQDQIRQIVKYAQERFITVVPEIEFPGHSTAAISAYPELSCDGKQRKVATKWGVYKRGVYCTKEVNFQFMEDVLSEVLELFPSKYIHVGGDEAPKDEWKKCRHCRGLIKREKLSGFDGLQSYFIRRIENFLNQRGRDLIGWDEILEGGLAPNATVMSWRGVKGGIEAAEQGHDVIMTPTDYCYFDYYQADKEEEPLAIGGYLPLKKVYSFDPVPENLDEQEAKHILGAQGNVWTEYMKDFKKVEYMTFPRIGALSEVVWTKKDKKDWDDFMSRMKVQYERYDVLGINYKRRDN